MKRESIAMIILGAFAGFIVASFVYAPPVGGIRFFGRPISVPRIVLFHRSPTPNFGPSIALPKVNPNPQPLQNNVKPELLPNGNAPQVQPAKNQTAPLAPQQGKNSVPPQTENPSPNAPANGVLTSPPAPAPANLPSAPPQP